MSYILTSALAALILIAAYILQRQRAQNAVSRSGAGGNIAKHRPVEPLTGLDFQARIHMDVPFLSSLHQRYGPTFQVNTLLARRPIVTIAPENIQVINSGKDWGVEPERHEMLFFCGRGFLTLDGDPSQQSRKLLKPIFAKGNIADLTYLSGEVEKLLSNLPAEGTTVDLQPLFYTMVCLCIACAVLYIHCVASSSSTHLSNSSSASI